MANSAGICADCPGQSYSVESSRIKKLKEQIITEQSRTSTLLRWSLLLAIFAVGATLRLNGLNWDRGHWIHPDEGHMRTILSSIQLPDDPSIYFDTHASPLNPRNSDQQYSYGTLPMFMTRALAEWLDRGCTPAPNANARSAAVAHWLLGDTECTPGTFTGPFESALAGRLLAALFDLGTLWLMYFIGRRLYGEAVGILAMALGAVTAFAIQQAHFFTVDSPTCFFIVLTAYCSIRAGQSDIDWASWSNFALAGVATGLAAASKVSAALAAGLVALAGLWWILRTYDEEPLAGYAGAVRMVLPRLILAAFLSLVAFRIAQPYAFEGPGFFGIQPSAEWFGRLGEIRTEQSGQIDLPSGRQWTNRLPLIFPWRNMVVWGMGIPLGVMAWAGWGLAGLELLRGRRKHLVLWGWVTLMFVFLGTRWVKSMRYFLPLYPLLTIMGAYALVRLHRAHRGISVALAGIVLAGTTIWAVAVFSIYERPHTRIAASEWIYANVPAGATVANEHWDWGLPLSLEGHTPFNGTYTDIQMENYNEDTPEKRRQFYQWLDTADSIFLASNRLYASIARLPERYPLTTEYYRALFAGELGFELAADVTSYPAIGPLQFPDQETPYPLMPAEYASQHTPISLPLPPAEESFSVYDHPRVLIFRKTSDYSRRRVEAVLGAVDVSTSAIGQTPREATPDWVLWAHDLWLYAGVGALVLLGVFLHRRRQDDTL